MTRHPLSLDPSEFTSCTRSLGRYFERGRTLRTVEPHVQYVVLVRLELHREVVVLAHANSGAAPGGHIRLGCPAAVDHGSPTAGPRGAPCGRRGHHGGWFSSAAMGTCTQPILEGRVGPLRASVDLPRAAEHRVWRVGLLAMTLAGWDLDPLRDDAQLVVSELVANAVTHAPGLDSYRLEVTRLSNAVRVSVLDGSPSAPAMRPTDDERPGGKGLRISEALAGSGARTLTTPANGYGPTSIPDRAHTESPPSVVVPAGLRDHHSAW